jgi:hypothetical protein
MSQPSPPALRNLADIIDPTARTRHRLGLFTKFLKALLHDCGSDAPRLL